MSSQENIEKPKSGYTKKILKILAEKPAIPLDALKETTDPKVSYAINRSVKNLVEAGYAEIHSSANQRYVRITPKGKTKLNSLRLLGEDMLVSPNWDGFWRIVILDIPEERKSEREALRYLLKKANFVCIKNTVWISPHPYEHLFTNIKKDLGFSTELMIVVADKLDEETRKAFFEATQN
jgi:DNA-binding transcriptional regulator PaaX